jgi:hypothetical protein
MGGGAPALGEPGFGDVADLGGEVASAPGPAGARKRRRPTTTAPTATPPNTEEAIGRLRLAASARAAPDTDPLESWVKSSEAMEIASSHSESGAACVAIRVSVRTLASDAGTCVHVLLSMAAIRSLRWSSVCLAAASTHSPIFDGDTSVTASSRARAMSRAVAYLPAGSTESPRSVT